MRRLQLLIALVAALVAGAGAGSYKGSSYGRASFGVAGSSYQAGASVAVEDTHIVIFSPETLVDAAIDTFGLPTSGQIAADVARVHYLNDVLLGRGAQSWREDDGDRATFIKLGAGGVTSFAYANISNYSPTAADTTGYINGSGDRIMLQSATSFVTDGVRVLDLSFPQILRKSELVYIPFEDYIPANATIVSATMNVSSASAPMLLTYTDSIIAQPLHPAWDKWMLVKDVGLNDNVAHAAWTSQESTGPAGAWGGTTRYPWVPDLDYLPKLWNVSKVSDWTTNITANVPEKSNFPISLTNTVQSFVNGAPNTGFMLNLADQASFTMSVTYYKWDASSSAAPRRHPAVIVKYVTKRYQKPYGSGDWAFLLATDDAIKACNDSIATIIQNRGMKFTVNAAYAFVGDAGFGDAADLLRWHDMGVEIASHTRGHPNPLGMNTYSISALPYAAADTTGAAWDSLTTQMSPEWMYSLADSMGRDMRSSPIYAKSIALPNNTWNPWVVKLAGQIGYKALRVGSMNPVSTNGALGMFAPATRGVAYTDTARVSFGTMYQRAPRNMMLLPTTQVIQQVVGLKANTTITEAQVKNNMARAAFQSKGDGRNALHMFFHDFKTAPTNAGYAEGVDPEEVRWMLDVVTEYGGRTMTQSEFTTWNMATAIPIDTPPDMLQDDLFRFEAHDGVWYKPEGLDKSWIRGLRSRTLAFSFDSTAPPTPMSALAYGQSGSTVLTWSPSATGESVSYRIYRFFDNAADTVMVGTSNSAFYVDPTAVNGTPHNYYVTAIDAAGNESAPTATMTTTPGTIRGLARPAYWAFWYQDAGATLADAEVNKLAAYDVVVGSPHSLEGAVSEPAYVGLLDRMRAVNPDAIYLTYFDAFSVSADWATSPAGSAGKRIWDYCVSLPDSGGLAEKITAGTTAHGDVYDTKFYNITNTTLADTVASILVDVFEGSGTDGEYAGFFLDDSDTTLSSWMCNGGDCGGLIDFDQDGFAFDDDATEKAAFKAWHIDLVKAIRREFAERDMPNRLVTANTTWCRKADPSPLDETYMALLDGMLAEGWNRYWPGPNVPTNTAEWDVALDWRTQLTHAQTAPPLVMWNAHADSSSQYMNEVAAYANGGLVNSQSDTDRHGTDAAPVIGRKIAALAPGNFATVAYDTVAGNATADTLTVTTGDLTARMIMSRNTGNILNQYAVWPYLITRNSDGAILSRSAFWPLPEEDGPPPVAQSQILTGDRMLTLAIGIGNDGEVPGDFSHFSIAREYKISSTAYYDTFTVDPDTLASVSGSPTSWWWYDTGLTNGRQYKYKVFLVDTLGNVGAPAPQVTQTPGDATAPGTPQAFSVAGGPGFIDLDWQPVSAPDLIGYQINRALDNGTGPGVFAVTDTVTASAHQDSTALSGQIYYFFVRALDDDGNRSAPTNTLWAGYDEPEIAETPPPRLMLAQADQPAAGQNRIAVVGPAVTDTTTHTGFQIFRSTTNDTATATLIAAHAPKDHFESTTYNDVGALQDPPAAYYYTAKAKYGAGRSEKYWPMVSATALNNFPSTRPRIALALGATGGVNVYWFMLQGSDSTRIFAGPDSNSTTYVTTVAAPAVSYLHAGAANTNWYYRIKQVNGAYVTLVSYAYGPASWVSEPSGSPQVGSVNEGVDNTVQHGEPVVIAGSNFGTKATAAPMQYDDFEEGTHGSVIATSSGTSGWDVVSAGGTGSGPFVLPIYSTTAGHVGNGMMARFEGTTGISRVRLDGDWSNGAYLDYWYKMIEDSSGLRSRNMKPWRFYGNDGTVNEYPQVNTFAQCVDGSVQLPVSMYGPIGSNKYMDPISTLFGTMKHWQVWLKPDLTGGSSGSLKIMVDGRVIEEANGTWKSQDATLAGNHWYQLSISGYYSKSAEGSCPPTDLTGNAYEYWDNWYIDNTQARVELGTSTSNPSNPTYAQCDHREIQVPTAWSATSVSITANTGSFADGNVYLFVIDADGVASPGQLVTIDNP